MSEHESLSQERLRTILVYNPETGEFTRNGRIAGGSYRHRNLTYRRVWVAGHQYSAHRLAWLYFYGVWPSGEVDHINGDGTDNRIANLRDATRGQNATNALAQKSSKTGLRGVHYHPGAKKYRAQICKNLKITHLGYFDTPEAAHQAYLSAARTIHGEFVRS
jgi:hypothetical protein